ncbi:MAG TPA: xanthine dehydrogenase family protein subunit M [Chloroflexia bacterium]|jgi:carbon-monoxide dehydrogenase medium subunit
MKPPPFEYYAPRTRQEALDLLAEHAGEAKVLAGGQSLVPSMNFRLAQPSILVDLNGVDDLFGIHPGEDGGLLVGAMTRHRSMERSPIVAERSPLIAEAMPFIAHPQIRNRGTFGGSLAHADPAAELPALAVALDAQMRVQNASGDRWIGAPDFFLGLFTTALDEDEMLVEVSVPPLPARTGTAFEEFARRHGDYALVGAAAVVTLGEDGTVAESRLVFLSVGDMPVVSAAASSALLGQRPTEEAIRAAAEAIEADIDPQADIHATAEYRRHLAKVLARRTLTRAAQRASGA